MSLLSSPLCPSLMPPAISPSSSPSSGSGSGAAIAPQQSATPPHASRNKNHKQQQPNAERRRRAKSEGAMTGIETTSGQFTQHMRSPRHPTPAISSDSSTRPPFILFPFQFPLPLVLVPPFRPIRVPGFRLRSSSSSRTSWSVVTHWVSSLRR